MASLFKSLTGGGYMNSHDDDAAAESIGYFDHVFQGALVHFSKGMGHTFQFGTEGDGNVKKGISLTCKQDCMEIFEKVGTGVNERERLVTSVLFKNMQKITWDHQNTSTRIEIRAATAGEFLTLEVENSLELEQNLSLRFVGAVREKLLAPTQVPSFSYLGMFAGPTKPKPFERKRANLTQIKQGKMPPLALMREIALERHRGSERPMAAEVSRRKKLSLDHIHDGVVAFAVFAASGAGGLSEMGILNAKVVLDDDGVVFMNDVRELGAAVASTTTRRMNLPFKDVLSWAMLESATDATKNGVQLTCSDGTYFFAVEDISHLRASLEFFYNAFRVSRGGLAQPGTTHGRQVLSLHTLMGEVDAPPAAVGSSDVMDHDGAPVKSKGAVAAPKRRSSLTLFSSAPAAVAARPSVQTHWGKLVLHNGWLLKKGGAAKSWLKRYFVLYKTSQGHFLSYYAEYWDSPLYNPSRLERNMIDLSKITYLRAKSKQRDAPPFSFDIATIEREWTLCAESNDELQLWLQVIARAVDSDVAIVPDDTLSFAVKARNDPSRRLDLNDYSTTLQISAWGVSVQKLSSGEKEEVHFWCYTDFYKWSILRQNGKLALSLQIFTSSDFKHKHDFVFRSLDAQAIATAIEYYIEKFMSRMHLRRELDEAAEAAPDTSPASANVVEDLLGPLESMGGGMGNEMLDLMAEKSDAQWASDDEDADGPSVSEAAPATELSLLDLMGAPAPAFPTATPDFVSAFPPAAPAFAPTFPPATPAFAPAFPTAAPDFVSAFPPAAPAFAPTFPPATPVFPPASPSPPAPAFVPPVAPPSDLLSMMSVSAPAAPSTTYAASAAKALFDALVTSEAPGLLFKNEHFEIVYQHEFRGAQARIKLKHTNCSASGDFKGVSLALSAAEPHLRTALTPGPGDASALAAGAGQTYQLMMECNQPFAAPPLLTVSFMATGGATVQAYRVQLPVLLTHFMAPAMLAPADFMPRWERLAGSGLEATRVVPSSLGSNAQLLMAKLQALKSLGVAADPDGGVLAASTLQTGSSEGKVVVGCMVKVALRAGQLAITVRTASPQVSPCLVATLAAFLATG